MDQPPGVCLCCGRWVQGWVLAALGAVSGGQAGNRLGCELHIRLTGGWPGTGATRPTCAVACFQRSPLPVLQPTWRADPLVVAHCLWSAQRSEIYHKHGAACTLCC